MTEAALTPASRSLKSRVVTGVLSLLLVGGLVVALAAFAYGRQAARAAYDRLLLGAANDIAETIQINDGVPAVDLPVSAFQLLALAPDDRIFYAVRDAAGRLITGLAGDLPQAASTPRAGAEARFFDDRFGPERARFVTVPRRFAERDYSGTIYVTVGQTLRAREAMALGLTRDALIVAGFAGVVLLVLGLVLVDRALGPLDAIARDLSARDPHDLTPMPTGVPAEMAVVIGAMNRFMGRLERQVEAMRNLISDTAHQLRTPVAALRVQAELAAEEPDPARARAMAARIARRSRALGDLLDQMLARALVIHRSDAARRAAVDLREVALGVIEAGDHELIAPGREVALAIGESPVEVMGDALSLSEAAKNLLVNALRHGAGRVEVGAGLEGGRAVLWVRDTGPGPGAEVLGRIGARFERNAAARGTSAGLGLSIARAVAEACGGTLALDPGPAGFRAALILPPLPEEAP
ncbi:MAG: sensor histidine kinase N-terminal domain-containing protein [Sphingomonadales bacterium]|nr:sensor histidine kinase N-terminal domain-containing protein [Sphingomonadales bacterium]